MNMKRDKLKNLQMMVDGVKKIPLQSKLSDNEDSSRMNESSFDVNQNEISNIHSEMGDNVKRELDGSRFETRTLKDGVLDENDEGQEDGVKNAFIKENEAILSEINNEDKLAESGEKKRGKLPLRLPKPRGNKKKPLKPKLKPPMPVKVDKPVEEKKEAVPEQKEDVKVEEMDKKEVKPLKTEEKQEKLEPPCKVDNNDKQTLEKPKPPKMKSPKKVLPRPPVTQVKPKNQDAEDTQTVEREIQREEKKESMFIYDDKTLSDFMELKNKLLNQTVPVHTQTKAEPIDDSNLLKLEQENNELIFQLDQTKSELDNLKNKEQAESKTLDLSEFNLLLEEFKTNEDSEFEEQVNAILQRQEEIKETINTNHSDVNQKLEEYRNEQSEMVNRITTMFSCFVERENTNIDNILDKMLDLGETQTEFESYVISENMTNLVLNTDEKGMSEVFKYIDAENKAHTKRKQEESLNNVTSMKMNIKSDLNIVKKTSIHKPMNRQASINNTLKNKEQAKKLVNDDPSLNFSDSNFEIQSKGNGMRYSQFSKPQNQDGTINNMSEAQSSVMIESDIQLKEQNSVSSEEFRKVEDNPDPPLQINTTESIEQEAPEEEPSQDKNEEQPVEEPKKLAPPPPLKKETPKVIEQTSPVQNLMKPPSNNKLQRKKVNIKKPVIPKPVIPKKTEEQTEEAKSLKKTKSDINIRQNLIKNYEQNDFVNFFDDLANSSQKNDGLDSNLPSRRDSAIKNDTQSVVNEREFEDETQSLQSLQYQGNRRTDRGLINPFKKLNKKKSMNIFKKKAKPPSKISNTIPDLF